MSVAVGAAMSAVTHACQTDGQTLPTVGASVGDGCWVECWRGKQANAGKCPGFTDRGLRLTRPAASPFGGYPKGKSSSGIEYRFRLSLDFIGRFGVPSRKECGQLA